MKPESRWSEGQLRERTSESSRIPSRLGTMPVSYSKLGSPFWLALNWGLPLPTTTTTTTTQKRIFTTTLTSTKLVENKFSGTPRCNRRIRNKKLYKADVSKLKTNWWNSSYEDLRPAVNRQPGFPRDVTRREGSACATTSIMSRFKLRASKNSWEIRLQKTRIMETPHLHNEEVIENFENCDPSESSPHSRQLGNNACELFEAWFAFPACLDSIFLEEFNSKNTHLGYTPSSWRPWAYQN